MSVGVPTVNGRGGQKKGAWTRRQIRAKRRLETTTRGAKHQRGGEPEKVLVRSLFQN